MLIARVRENTTEPKAGDCRMVALGWSCLLRRAVSCIPWPLRLMQGHKQLARNKRVRDPLDPGNRSRTHRILLCCCQHRNSRSLERERERSRGESARETTYKRCHEVRKPLLESDFSSCGCERYRCSGHVRLGLKEVANSPQAHRFERVESPSRTNDTKLAWA